MKNQNNLPNHAIKFTFRIEQILLDKIIYIADCNGRTKNKEIEHIIKIHIEEFENKHGKIELE